MFKNNNNRLFLYLLYKNVINSYDSNVCWFVGTTYDNSVLY